MEDSKLGGNTLLDNLWLVISLCAMLEPRSARAQAWSGNGSNKYFLGDIKLCQVASSGHQTGDFSIIIMFWTRAVYSFYFLLCSLFNTQECSCTCFNLLVLSLLVCLYCRWRFDVFGAAIWGCSCLQRVTGAEPRKHHVLQTTGRGTETRYGS